MRLASQRSAHTRRRTFVAAFLAAITFASLVFAAPPLSATSPTANLPRGSEVTGEDIDLVFLLVAERLPLDGERNDWLRQTSEGAALEELVRILANLTDFDAILDAPTNDEFIDALYVHAFGREADAGGREYWLGRLASDLSRETVVLALALSDEFGELMEPVSPPADGDPDPLPVPEPIDAAFELNILHINDHHSHLQADDIDLPLGGFEEVNVDLGGFGRVAGLIKDLEGDHPNTVKIHAGDAMSGTLFFSLFKGEADAAVMNETCFDVFAVGNHEFDEGDQGLDDFLDYLNDDPCGTVTLGANVVPAIGTPLAPVTTTDYIQPFTVKEFNGVQVGFVGLVIAQKTQVSSSPLPTTEFLDEVTTAQKYVDQLTAEGIDNIVLVTHYQYENDLALASQVTGVDVIIGGDSHSLLGDEFTQYGFTPDGPYPTSTTDPAGNPVCIATAWQYSNVVGELMVGFDEDGTVVGCQGTPHLLLGDNFSVDDVALEGDDLAAVLAEVEASPVLNVVTPDPATEAIIDGFAAEVEVLQQAVVGTATSDLCLARVPNDTRTSIPTCAGNTPNGGDIQQLVTEAFLARAFRADIALQNSGGVRVDIPAGPVTVADVYTLLPFANTMVEMDLTGAEIQATLEEGISNWLDNDGSSGAYPYASGLRFDVDLSQPTGSRFSNLEYNARGTDTWVPLDPSATYVVVTNSFMASGGDGYETMGAKFAAGDFVDTFLDYAQTFIDYIEEDAGGIIEPVSIDRYSTQNFVPLPEG